MITFTLIRCRREINMHVAIWLKWLMMRFLGVFCLTRPGETYTAERFQLLVFCHKLQKWRLMFQFFRCSVADVCRKSRDNVLLELSGGRSEHNSLRWSRSLYFRLLHVRLCARVYWAAWNGGANLLSARNSDLDLFQDLMKNWSMSNLLFSTPTLCRTCVGPAIEFLSDMTHRAVCGPDNTRPTTPTTRCVGQDTHVHECQYSTDNDFIQLCSHTLSDVADCVFSSEGLPTVIDTGVIGSLRCWLYGVDMYIATRWFKRGQRECCWHGHSYLVTLLFWFFSHSIVRKSSWLGTASYHY